RAGSRASVALEVHTQEARRAKLGNELPAKVIVLEVLLDGRQDAVLGERAGLRLPVTFLLAQQRGEIEDFVNGCGHGSPCTSRRRRRFTCSLISTVCAPSRGGALVTSNGSPSTRSEEHTSELQSRENLVCRLLLE